MKQLLRFKTFLLMAVLSLLAGTSAWAETETITFSELGLSNGNQYLEPFTSGDVSVTFAGGQNDGKYYTTGAGIRTYGNGTITIEASDNTITSIALTFAGAGYAPSSIDVWSSNGTGTGTSGVNASWSGNASQVVLTRPSGSGHWRLQSVAVTYETGTTPSKANPDLAFAGTEFTINLGDAFTAPALTFVEGFDGTVTYESSNTAVATVDQSGTVTIAGAGKTTITASSAETENYRAATASYTLTVVDPNGPGTENNPYTVAEARAAIDAGTGMTGVYAKGIVSEIVTAYNSQYGNITYNISDDGTTTADQLQAYRGMSYNGEDFTSEDDIQVGDAVVIYGTLKKYKTTYEFDANNQLVSLQRPVVSVPTIGLSTTTVNAEAAGANGTIDVTYANFTAANPGIELFEADGTTPATYGWLTASFDDDATIVYTIQENTTTEARTAYFKSYAMNGETKIYSALVTVAQAGVVVDYATLPFSFDGGKADVEGTNGLTHEGLGSDYSTAPKLKFDSTGDALVLKFNERPGKLTFDIKGNSFSGGTFTVQTSEDGVTYTDLETYDALADMQSEEFNNLGEDVRYIKWVYTEKSSGNVALGNIALAKYSAPAPSITIDPATYTMDAKAGGGEIPVVSENLASDPQLAVVFVEADGVTPATYDWITATINNNGNIDGAIQANTGDARTAYFYVTGKDANGNTVQSNLVTFTQEAPVAATPTIVFNPESIDFDANSGYRTIGGDYFQLKDFDSTPSLEILYYKSDGDTEKQGGYDWLTADFNSNNQIDFAWNTNTGAARSAYLKIHAVGTTVYSNLFTVNQAAPTTDYVTLPFNWAGGASADLTAIAGVTASGIGSDYAATHDPYLVKFDSDGDYIQFKTNEQPGVVTIGVKMIGGGNTSTITVQGSADGDKFTDIEELTISGKQNDIVNLETTTSFAATDRYVRLTFTKGSNVGVGPITIAKYVATPSITITPATVNAKANDNGGELTVTYENLAATPNLQIVFVESDGETAATYNWISAEFNSNGNIDGILQPNTGDARTAYLVVTGVDADNNVVKSNLVTINQAAPAAPSITVEKGSIDFVAGGESDRKMSFEYESLGNSPSFEVVFFDELGTTVTTYDWVTTATIENNEKVNLSVAQNDGAARTAYFKVHETATDVYSNLVTINQAAAADPNTIIFDFTTNDWGLPLTSENVSERREFKKDGYTIALTAGGNNKYGFNTDGYLLLGKNGATLEFPIFDFLVDKITIEGNTGASTSVKQAIYMKTYSEGLKQASSTTTGATGTNEYNISWGCQAAGEELLLQVTSAHNTQITRILIHKKETVDVTIGSTGYATLYYGDKNFSYGRKGGVSAYAVNLTNGALKMEAISNQAVIPAGTAMVLEGNPGTHVFEVEDAAFSSIAAEAEVNFTGCDNLLRGYDEPALTTGPDAGDYLFYLLGVDNGKVGFYWGKDNGAAFTSGAHKAYLAVPAEKAGGVRAFYFDDTTTGIDTLNLNVENENAYDLQGRRVQQLQKGGLYIVDGKKMLAK